MISVVVLATSTTHKRPMFRMIARTSMLRVVMANFAINPAITPAIIFIILPNVDLITKPFFTLVLNEFV